MRYQDIAPHKLSEILELEDLVIIDQREPSARAQGHLEGAMADSDSVIRKLVRQRRRNPSVLVYCKDGNQSADLCHQLYHFGLSKLYTLSGGWDALQRWKQESAINIEHAPIENRASA